MTDFVLIAAGDWVGVVFTIVMLIFYAINNLMNKNKEARNTSASERLRRVLEQQQRQAQREQERRGEYAQPGYQEQPAEEPTEVDAFLREVAALRDRARSGGPVMAEIVEEEPAPRRLVSQPAAPQEADVNAHLRQYMQAHQESFASRVSHDVDTTDIDSKLDDQIAAKFDHGLGALGTDDPTDATYDPQRAAAAHPVMAIFQDPTRLRRTFIGQELLARPSWDQE